MAIIKNTIILFIITLFLNNNNILIQVKSEPFSFSFPTLNYPTSELELNGGAAFSNGELHLTKIDTIGNPFKFSMGIVAYSHKIPLYTTTPTKATTPFNFTTDFDFIVRRPSSAGPHGDGMTFFIATPDYAFPLRNSTGGFLGLFTPQTAFSPPGMNKIVAVEFDSFANGWDPNPGTQSPHIGIDVGSIKSKDTFAWPVDDQPNGVIASATVSYDSESLEFRAVVRYPDSVTTLISKLDLTEVLPENVIVGFSAATGDLVESYRLSSWNYRSTS